MALPAVSEEVMALAIPFIEKEIEKSLGEKIIHELKNTPSLYEDDTRSWKLAMVKLMSNLTDPTAELWYVLIVLIYYTFDWDTTSDYAFWDSLYSELVDADELPIKYKRQQEETLIKRKILL